MLFRNVYKGSLIFEIRMADKVQMPSSMGGLVRYFDEYKSKLELSPGAVIVLIILLVVIEIILHSYGGAWFG